MCLLMSGSKLCKSLILLFVRADLYFIDLRSGNKLYISIVKSLYVSRNCQAVTCLFFFFLFCIFFTNTDPLII